MSGLRSLMTGSVPVSPLKRVSVPLTALLLRTATQPICLLPTMVFPVT